MCGEILFQDFDYKPKITQDWNCRTTESQRLEGNARDHQVQPAAKPGTIHCNDNFILQVIEKLRKGAVLNLSHQQGGAGGNVKLKDSLGAVTMKLWSSVPLGQKDDAQLAYNPGFQDSRLWLLR